MPKPLLSIPETAEVLGRHPETVRRMIRSGELRGVLRHGGGWVTRHSVEELVGARLSPDEQASTLAVTVVRAWEGPGRGSVVVGLGRPDDDPDEAVLEGRALVFPQEAVPELILALKMIREADEDEVVITPETITGPGAEPVPGRHREAGE